MKIEKITKEVCSNRKEEIALFIYNNCNFGHESEWYSMQEALAKVEVLASYIVDGSAIPFMALENEKMVGFVWGYPCADRRDDGRIYISILQVDEEYRGMSIGRKLVEAVQKEALSRNNAYHKIWLYTDGYEGNKAIDFYEKIGFKKERIQYVKEIR